MNNKRRTFLATAYNLIYLKLVERMCWTWHRTCYDYFEMHDTVKLLILFFLPGNVHCGENTTVDYLKGDIQVEVKWQATEVGSRRFVRCPYAYDRALYAHRDCILSSIIDRSPKWTDANVTMCPEPPFSRGVHRLANFLVGNLFVCLSLHCLGLTLSVCHKNLQSRGREFDFRLG